MPTTLTRCIDTSSPTPAGRWLVVSFHDLAPHTQRPGQELLLQLASLGVPRTSLLVVPRWHGVESIDDRPYFLHWLRSLAAAGHEICLHGLTHQADTLSRGLVRGFMGRVYTAGEGEFYAIERERAESKVREGEEILATAGCPARGFVAPAWLLSPEGREVLRRLGFAYTVTLRHLELLQEDRRILAPTVAFSTRSLWRRMISPTSAKLRFAASRQAPILRISVHPEDLYEPGVRRALVAILREALSDRTPVTYGELAALTASGDAS